MATARNPAPMTAITGTTSLHTIPTAAISAAKAHGLTASDHGEEIASIGTEGADPADDKGSTASGRPTPAIAASATTTRICGAEQCGQKGTPCSTACPHL